ncbi:MAG: hypothetical protein V4449_00720 [Patescibacteria group bacterium]
MASWKGKGTALEETRKAMRDGGGDLQDSEEKLLEDDPIEMPKFPFNLFGLSALKDALDIGLTLTGVGIVLTFVTGVVLWVVLFFWCIADDIRHGDWWKKMLIKSIWKKWIWKRLSTTVVAEFIPGLNVLPLETIFVLVAYRKKRSIVKMLNDAREELQDTQTAEGPMPAGYNGGMSSYGGTPNQNYDPSNMAGANDNSPQNASRDSRRENTPLESRNVDGIARPPQTTGTTLVNQSSERTTSSSDLVNRGNTGDPQSAAFVSNASNRQPVASNLMNTSGSSRPESSTLVNTQPVFRQEPVDDPEEVEISETENTLPANEDGEEFFDEAQTQRVA